MTPQEIKQEIRQLRAEMRTRGVRIVSCFNAGLTADERRYNTQLFALKVKLQREQVSA